jgi:hypothetical protein
VANVSKSDIPEAEARAGSVPYLRFLADLHQEFAPRGYVEIGVRYGSSLQLAFCPAIGIDPAAAIARPLPETTRVIHKTSDAYFARGRGFRGFTADLAFIDGMHLFEFALRDFIALERRMPACGLIIMDDICPNHPLQAARERETQAWTGDVWKMVPCLRKYRPELSLLIVDTNPTGLLLVSGLDPLNRVLSNSYDEILADDLAGLNRPPPSEVLLRDGVIYPYDVRVAETLVGLMEAR